MEVTFVEKKTLKSTETPGVFSASGKFRTLIFPTSGIEFASYTRGLRYMEANDARGKKEFRVRVYDRQPNLVAEKQTWVIRNVSWLEWQALQLLDMIFNLDYTVLTMNQEGASDGN